ncbi:type II toxin-antitoxin system Phd/YefM family antitoxin [Sphingomonas sp. MMS24-JH45]
MERSISASEANQHFSQLLRDVAGGDRVTVVSRGRAVARMVPVDHRRELIQRLLAFVERLPLRQAGEVDAGRPLRMIRVALDSNILAYLAGVCRVAEDEAKVAQCTRHDRQARRPRQPDRPGANAGRIVRRAASRGL